MGVRKLLIAILFLILFLISCTRSALCILDCHIESDDIIICLNTKYKIGEIQGGAVGDLEFAKHQTDNFIINRNKNDVTIMIKNKQSIVFDDGIFYKIYIQWYGGYVESLSKFENGKFIVGNENYFDKGPL